MPNITQKSLNRILKSIQKEIEWVDKQLDKKIADVPQWKALVEILTSAKGVGKVLAYTLISELPELGKLNRKEIAALVVCLYAIRYSMSPYIKTNVPTTNR